MRKSIHLFICFQLLSIFLVAQPVVKNLLCENLSDPVGIDNTEPTFSWQLVSDKRNLVQTAYEIRVSTKAASIAKSKEITWSTGKVDSDSSVHVTYKGARLQPGTKYFWQVRVWDNSGKASAWSKPASWQMGLLSAKEWKAKWIQAGFAEDTIERPSPLFRKGFVASKKIQSAISYVTSHGMYEACINGKHIGDAY